MEKKFNRQLNAIHALRLSVGPERKNSNKKSSVLLNFFSLKILLINQKNLGYVDLMIACISVKFLIFFLR
jgi:hypothetical protein